MAKLATFTAIWATIFFLLATATKHSQLEMLCAHRQLSQIWIGSLENCQ